MTTANLLSVSPVGAQGAVSVDTTKKLQEENLEVAEMFAAMMNQTVDFSNSVVDESSSNMDVAKADVTQTPAQSYERYSYKDNKIEAAEEQTVTEKLEEAGVDMEEVSQEVIDTLKEEYGVTEEQILDLLEQNGLTVLDLLNPQNLVNFVVQLTGVASGEELLLDESFLQVMETVDNLAQNLMRDLNVDMEGLQEIIAEFELVENAEVPENFQNVLDTQLQEKTDTETTQVVDEAVVEVAEGNVVKDTEADKEVKIEVEAEEVQEEPETQVETNENEDAALKQETDTTSFTSNENSSENSLLGQNQNSNEAVLTTPQNNTPLGQVNNTSFSQFTSYTSVDTVQIMEQIVEQMRVTISSERTSMEMQLNPENLGKVTVHVSSEEGVVNAQFTATNEIVKEALETQIATLRESLNQAGVKVDAIEVTVETHQFEQNLEQNQQKAEEEQAQGTGTKRRNLSLDSLDELAGVMTEEEALVAQMMKDNGNSVDFTA